MGLGFKPQAVLPTTMRQTCAVTLALLTGLGPLAPNLAHATAMNIPSPTSTAAGTTPLPKAPSIDETTGQGNAQKNAGSNNSLAQTLGTVMGVVSMGLGGLYMAKGAQQLSCCSSGCTGAGNAAKIEDAALKNTVKDSVNQGWGTTFTPPDPIKGNTAVPFKLDLNLRYPDGASLDKNKCPKINAPAVGIFSLMNFFHAPAAQAATGCLDAMIALATGGLMMLQGVMSLNAANQAGKNADTSFGNASNMGNFGTSPTPESIKTGSLGQSGGRSGEMIKIDPSLLRTGKANDIMGKFEDKFGISRDSFAQSVAQGEDPRSLLGNAPRNALSNADMNKATSAAAGMSAEDKANALAATELAAAQAEMAAKMEQYAVNPAAGGPSRMVASKKADDELDAFAALVAPVPQPAMDALPTGVSQEVRDALMAKAQNERKHGITELTIFQLVSAKYREKSKVIFGFDPDGVPRGVGNANGL